MLISCHFFPFQFNFVGRILGPRGMTAKQLEQETGCKIMVRGKGSMRDKKKVSSMHTCYIHMYMVESSAENHENYKSNSKLSLN